MMNLTFYNYSKLSKTDFWLSTLEICRNGTAKYNNP